MADFTPVCLCVCVLVCVREFCIIDSLCLCVLEREIGKYDFESFFVVSDDVSVVLDSFFRGGWCELFVFL